MPTVEKIIEKMKNSPNSITPRELDRVLNNRGFVLTHRTGSHATYKNISTNTRLVIPIHNPIKACYIDETLRKIGENNEN